jgi:signal transduction histidine kinase
VINAEEEERKRIARELHDGIGQQMTGLKMAWQVFNQNFLKDQKAVIAESERLLKILDNSAAEVRSISHQMMPRALKEAGLPGAISDLLAVYFGNSNIQYELNVSGMDEKLNKNIEITVFRVCQELINNIVKHSGASHIDLQLYRSRENLILSVTDNGAGFNVNDKKEGIGLMNIKSRVENVNGIFFIESELSKGSRATIRIPLPVV